MAANGYGAGRPRIDHHSGWELISDDDLVVIEEGKQSIVYSELKNCGCLENESHLIVIG